MGRPVDVEIMGQRLTVTSEDGEEHVRQVAGYVDQRMRQLARGQVRPASLHLALITALNIASEYWKLQRQQEDFCQMIDRVAQRVSSRLGRLDQPVRKGEDTARR